MFGCRPRRVVALVGSLEDDGINQYFLHTHTFTDIYNNKKQTNVYTTQTSYVRMKRTCKTQRPRPLRRRCCGFKSIDAAAGPRTRTTRARAHARSRWFAGHDCRSTRARAHASCVCPSIVSTAAARFQFTRALALAHRDREKFSGVRTILIILLVGVYICYACDVSA